MGVNDIGWDIAVFVFYHFESEEISLTCLTFHTGDSLCKVGF